jgi:cyclomaltodextrinase
MNDLRCSMRFGVGAACVLLLCAGALAAAPVEKHATVQVTFTLKPEGTPAAVYVAGTFNNWNASQDAMKDVDGVFEVTLSLKPGSYEYKFVVDGNWLADPYAALSVPDPYGGKNSVVVVPDDVDALVVGVKAPAQGGAAGAAPAAGAGAQQAAAAAPAGTIPVTFLFDAGKGSAATIYLAGTFNGWDASKDRMTDPDGDGIYEITMHLAPGSCQYKFVKDGQWITDTNAKEFADDGFGGKNSVLVVPATAPEKGLVVGMFTKLPEKYGGAAGAAQTGAAPAAGAAAPAQGPRVVTFRYKPDHAGVQNVFLAGTFNDWSTDKTRMTANKDGVFEATLLLPAGKYQYKFVADGQWITDMSAKEFVDDGFGGKNSVIIVDDSFPESKIEKGDGLMMNSDIPLTLDYSMVNALSPTTIEFRARAHMNDVERAALVLPGVSGKPYKTLPMTPAESDGVFQYYRYLMEAPSTSTIRFAFAFTDDGKDFYETPAGFVGTPPAPEAMFLYSDTILAPFFTPDWAKNGVFYQIFPERFRNGDTTNDPDFHEPYYAGVTTLPPSGKTNGEYFHFVTQWDNVTGLTHSPYRTDGKPDYYSFYGGDIKGVMEEIPYLHDLGITIIYFNPLNQARSNHKYDAIDYLKIDPHFADEATFIAFVKKAHENGIRIIVDMALNHTGSWHWAFVDTKEKGPDSKYWNWYEWKRWPLPKGPIDRPCDYYDCWWCFGDLPDLNYDLSRPNDQENAVTDISQAKPEWDVVNYVLEVPAYWIGKLGIDGFRLDVPNEVPFWFWKLFRKAVDKEKPDALLVGELWGNAMPWLGPQYFHSTMNYKYFKDPVVKFIALGQGSAADFDRELAPGRSVYPIQATETMMNLIDSHDTERFITTAGNNADRIKLAALFEMTYVGTPHIYYGDEVGLRGGKDPDDRRTFPWDWETNPGRKEIHDFYRAAIAARHKYPALRTGSFRTVLTDGRVYSFLREDGANRILVVLNGDTGARDVEIGLKDFGFADGTSFKDEMSGAASRVSNGTLKISLQPLAGAVLVSAAK